jgi:hypothetical protein
VSCKRAFLQMHNVLLLAIGKHSQMCFHLIVEFVITMW